ncbi:MAG: ABC transporter ATP-binding protein [Clostridiales bacterium]|jgi:iron complex transport system ATP-binding protein|nr:ABC transporter ATP-binding protein [Clostridiales bacterium]
MANRGISLLEGGDGMVKPALLELRRVCCGYGANEVVRDVSFSLHEGEILCLLGPNGVGKTTLFKAVLGFIKTTKGSILVEGKEMSGLGRRQLAKSISFVPQAHRMAFPFSVIDIVLMGRVSHTGTFGSPGRKDSEIAMGMLRRLGIEGLHDKSYSQISGGQQQMVLIARALAQQAKIVIMDEPAASLDYGNQVMVLEQVKKLSSDGISVLMTTHSPDHAFLCATKVAFMKQANCFELGEVEEMVTESQLSDAYGIQVKIAHALGGDGELVSGCIPLIGKKKIAVSPCPLLD